MDVRKSQLFAKTLAKYKTMKRVALAIEDDKKRLQFLFSELDSYSLQELQMIAAANASNLALL